MAAIIEFGLPTEEFALQETLSTHPEAQIELVAGDASDVARFDVRVRDQEQTIFIQRDDVHGVQAS